MRYIYQEKVSLLHYMKLFCGQYQSSGQNNWGILMTGVYEARKKSGEIYYRASFTYKNKHISLGSSSDEASCHAMYNEACEIINNSSDHWIDTDHRTTSYNEAMTLSLGKYISLINFRDNNIYIKTPIYMCHLTLPLI